MRTRCSVLPLLALLLVPATGLAADPFQEILKDIPDNANALLLIDVQAIHQSPLGVKENWGKDHEQNYLSGATSIPPSVNRMAVAAQFNPTALESAWKIGLFELRDNITLEQLARTQNGSLDQVAGQQVVLSPRNAYCFIPAPRTVGLQRPANRQEMARWVRFTKQNKQVVISPYLQQAATAVTKDSPLTLA